MEKSKRIQEQNKRQEYDNKRYENVFKLVILLKMMYIILALISLLSKLATTQFNIKDNILMVAISGSIISIMMNYYLSWSANYTKDRVYDKYSKKDYFESFALTIIFILVIGSTGWSKSDYKILSILATIIGAIQFGQRYSIGISICYSVIILGVDLLFNDSIITGSAFYFERDLVLTAVLLIISIVLGMYVDIERQYFKELKIVANMDELTGIYNHRYFQDSLSNIIKSADENNREVSLLFMDIDYFKHYNDTHGHPAGDLLLMEVADLLKSCIRNRDVLARYGGEEFAVILPDTSIEQAIDVGERIRKRIEETKFEGQEFQPNKNLTMSIGVSTYPTIASSKYELINTADQALYKAKAFNRNRVERYQMLLDELYKNKNLDKDILNNIKIFIKMINEKDKYTYGHVERVATTARDFGRYLNLSPEEQLDLQIGAYLHDIGKFNISKEILNKKENLNDKEFEVFKDHCVYGEEIISEIECLKPFIPMVKYHHERYDGRGYPEGLKGEEIPYLSRILAIIDSYDSMIFKNQYINDMIIEEAKNYIKAESGRAFDPELVDSYIKMLESKE